MKTPYPLQPAFTGWMNTGLIWFIRHPIEYSFDENFWGFTFLDPCVIMFYANNAGDDKEPLNRSRHIHCPNRAVLLLAQFFIKKSNFLTGRGSAW
jgi:hypothetical protein